MLQKIFSFASSLTFVMLWGSDEKKIFGTILAFVMLWAPVKKNFCPPWFLGGETHTFNSTYIL
jgi:hypothetical protein